MHRLTTLWVVMVLAVAAAAVSQAVSSDGPGTVSFDQPARPMIADLVTTEVHVDPAPPAPVRRTGSAATVLVAGLGGADDLGLDATVATLLQRPDLFVVAVAPGATDGEAVTRSGHPVQIVASDAASAAALRIESPTSARPDLVVVAMSSDRDHAPQATIARMAAAHGIPALAVQVVSGSGVVDYGAGGMQLLDILDRELDLLVAGSARAVRLSVPSCDDGSVRGRIEVAASEVVVSEVDCVSDRLDAPGTEAEAVAAGFVAVAELE